MSAILYDNYVFIKELGVGGLGRVFLALDKIANRYVAIKELLSKDKKDQQDIITEIKNVSKFQQPNVVSFFHHFLQNDLLYLVMEHCSKGSLRDSLRTGKANEHNAFLWTQILCEAFEIIHEKGIVHHDIKPDNILFNEDGVIKISDFGIANTLGGTKVYMSPEMLTYDSHSTDPRADIYALGMTLLEMLTGKNPFWGKSTAEILALHDKGEFNIKALHNWQQEIILKAINKVPELRFQSMTEFAEAIRIKQVPFVINKEVIRSGDLAEKANRALTLKKWGRVRNYIQYVEENLPPSVNMLKVAGRYYLLRQNIKLSKKYYEKALKLNPRLDVQKDLGWINLELKNYPTAISLLSDHLHRNPSDYEAYNLLIQCYYETDRYEAAMQLSRLLLDMAPTIPCFATNYYVSNIMNYIGSTVFPSTIMKVKNNFFVDYNLSVMVESEASHNHEKKPTLKSKLLFQDYRFNTLSQGNTLQIKSGITGHMREFTKPIIKFGRRHCVIVNTKDEVMLYDLDSTGTYVNGEKLKGKIPLSGLNTIQVAGFVFTVNTDKEKLL